MSGIWTIWGITRGYPHSRGGAIAQKTLESPQRAPIMRRRAYLATAGGVIASVAGCLDEPRLEYAARSLEYERHHLGFRPGPDAGVTWFFSTDQAIRTIETRDWLGEATITDARDFLLDDEDDGAEVFELVAGGPTAGHSQIELDFLAYTDDEIFGSAAVVHDGDTTPEPAYPSTLIRFFPPDDAPGIARFEISDGWGETTEFIAMSMADPPQIGLDNS